MTRKKQVNNENGCRVDIPQGIGMAGAGILLIGSAGSVYLNSLDSYHDFKTQLVKFVDWLRTGIEPFPFEETVELMKMVVAGLKSREEGGRVVLLSEIEAE